MSRFFFHCRNKYIMRAFTLDRCSIFIGYEIFAHNNGSNINHSAFEVAVEIFILEPYLTRAIDTSAWKRLL